MKITQETVDLCRRIAHDAHLGQKRESGEDYITHPEAVAAMFPKSLRCQCVTWLHDTIEDNPSITKESLSQAGIPRKIVNNVITLTRVKGTSYAKYIENIWSRGTRHEIAVKIADLKHNLATCQPGARRDKYELSFWILKTSRRNRKMPVFSQNCDEEEIPF